MAERKLPDSPAKSAAIGWIVGLGSLALALFFALLGWQALGERENLWQLQMAKQGELQRLALQSTQTGLREQARLLAETIAADAWVTELVRQAQLLSGQPGGADEAARNAIRTQLYTRLAPRWRNLQAEHPFRLYVHLAAEGPVLLRVHRPQATGGDVERGPMVRDALRQGRSQAGLGSAPGSLGMRAVTPLQVEGRSGPLTVGAIEVAFGALADLQQLDRELAAGVALLVRQNPPETPDSDATLPGQAPHWRLMDASRPQVRRWHEQRRLPAPGAGTTLKLLTDQARTYLLNQVLLPSYQPLDAPAAPALAIALVWRDVSDLYAVHRRDLRWLVGKWLLAWLGAETLLLLLLLATRDSTQALMRRHQQQLRLKHRQSEQSRQLLALIAQAQAAYIDAQSQRATFDALLRRIVDLSASRFGCIGEVRHDAGGAPFFRSFAVGGLAADNAEQREARQAPDAFELHDLDTLLGQAIRSGQPLLVNPPLPATPRSGLPAGHPPLLSCAALPIHARGQLLGLLVLGNRSDGYRAELVEQLQPLLATLGQLLEALRRDAQREQTQHRLRRQQDALRALNEIAALPKLSHQEQLRQALRLGAAFYQLPQAIISQIEGEDYRVLVQVSPADNLSDGQQFALGDTYCSIALQSDAVLAIERMAQSAHASHPCYRRLALETYIGVALWVAGRRFGTLNFSAAEPRSQPFDEADHEFLRLFARWVGATLERQQQEQARQELLERLQKIAGQVPGMVYQYQQGGDGSACFPYASEGIRAIYGLDPEQVRHSAEPALQRIHPDDLDAVSASIEHSAASLKTWQQHYRVQHPQHGTIWVEGRASPERLADGGTLWHGFITDISEQRRQQQARRETRRFLETLINSATEVAMIATDTEGLITLFNSGAERLLGYPAAEVIGRHSPLLFHRPAEVAARASELSAELGHEVRGFSVFIEQARHGRAESRQWTYLRKDGLARTVNLTTTRILDDGGAISGYLGIATDVSDLQQATRALQKSESRFRGMVANLPGVVYRCHNDSDWTMHYVSEEILALSGYPASDFIDNRVRSYASVIHPDDLPTTFAVATAIARQESFELTYRLQHADGHSVWVREKGRGEFDSRGQLQWIAGFIWDISERKAVEDELKLSQQRFSSAFNTAPQGMALVSPQGRWLEVNDELCRMLGYSREELLRTDFQHITHPADLDADLEKLEDLLHGRINAYQMEKRYLDKQGRTLCVLLSVSLVRDGEGRPVHFVSQIQDFSDRVAAERAVREREHYLRTLLDNVLDAIVTIDRLGYIETFNRAAERLFGYSLMQVIGRNVKLLMPEPERSAHDGYLAHYRQTGETRLIGTTRELIGLRSNGEQFAIELAVSQISHQGQQRFIAVIRDISERKRIEQMKDDFVSTVSHELRTPLTAIAGSLGLINGGVLGEVPAGMRQMLSIAQDNSLRLGALINDLLDMDKLVAGKMHFDLREQPLMPLLEQALEQNQPYARRLDVSLQLLERADAARVRVDSQRLLQVLANLLSNAAKFSQAGQVVELHAQLRAEQVRVSVRDHGAGVPEPFQARIFSKFSQADATSTREKGGTGLGLAISKEIIERLDGRIGFDSREGQGATFWFELPTLGGAAP